MSRLEKQLCGDDLSEHPVELVAFHREETRAKNWVWSEIMWTRAASRTDVDACVFLQDDLEVAPDFWKWLLALVEGRPNDVIGLENAHPGARVAFLQGHPGYTTCDGLIGVGYVIPRAVLVDFIEWRRNELVPQGVERISEDSLIGLYCLARDRKIFHPTPTFIDHDLDISSTYGNDGHMYRAPQVTWRELDRLNKVGREAAELNMSSSRWWSQSVPHLGRFYEGLHAMLPLLLRDKEAASARYLESEADVPPKEYSAYFLRTFGAR